MPITPPITEAPLIYAALDIITDAMIEVGISAAGEPLDSDQAQWAFRKLNYLTDTWAARRAFVYASTFNTYTLVPNLSPHTIGPEPGATFVVPQRPVKIVGATIVLNNSTPPVSVILNLRDEQWWIEQTIQGLESQQPTDLFYNPAFPNGELYFWPAPNVAYQTQLQCWSLLSQYSSITDPIGGPGGPGTAPPAYRSALMLSLAETLGGQPPPNLAAMAATARAAVFGNNSKTVRMQTRDSGVPGGDENLRSTTFNYLNRSS
jgi:hypothetical protein